MILVLLGTQKNNFNRLLEAIQFNIDNGVIQEEVIVQAGCTTYNSENMKIFSLIPMNELETLIEKARIIITHGGVGSIVGALKKGKKVIAMPRLSKYHEHVNDHQLEITSIFSENKYILVANDKYELQQALNSIEDFKPEKYQSNTNSIIKIIQDFIDNN